MALQLFLLVLKIAWHFFIVSVGIWLMTFI